MMQDKFRLPNKISTTDSHQDFFKAAVKKQIEHCVLSGYNKLYR